MTNNTAQSGYVALLAVLIVGAASIAAGLALLLTGTDSQRSTLVLQQSIQARTMATSCAEEALQVIYENNAFTGTAPLVISGQTCSYTVTNSGGNTRIINANSTINNVVRKVRVYVTINTSSISITSWQEVS